MEPTKSDLTRAGYVQKSGDKVTGDYRPPRQTPPRQIPAPVDVHSTSSRRHSVKHTLQATTADIEIEGTAPSGTPRAGTDAGHWFWDHESATGASIIHLTTTDANSSNWPAEYIYGVSDVDPGELQPFIRIDVEEAYDPDVIAIHERERRKKMLEDWLIDAGSYIGNRETGAVKGSSKWRKYRLARLPPGYGLFIQQRREGVKTAARRDAYLYGSQERFRSRKEFFEHAWWLYTEKEGHCDCPVCNPKTSKSTPKKTH